MSKSFLITSHTEGAHPFEQRTVLHGLVKSLKHYFPDCFIVVASQSEVEVDTQQLADYVIIDRKTVNQPYGSGEVALLTAGLNIMKQFGRKDCYKMVYDFIIDDTNYQVFDQWVSHNKDFVGCYWRTTGLGIGSWIWYGTVEIQQKILDVGPLTMFLEWTLLDSIKNKNLIDSCYIYHDHEAMFNGDWFDRCDLVHSGGAVLKHNYGTVVASLDLTDETEYYIPVLIQQLSNQTKCPNHLVLVDHRSNKTDLRIKEVYQELFALLSEKQISWNLIFYGNQKQVVDHLSDLGHTWCWLINSKKVLNQSALKTMYQHIIFNSSVGTIIDLDGNLLYRNKVVSFEGLNTDSRQFIVDKMKETCYTNILVQ